MRVAEQVSAADTGAATRETLPATEENFFAVKPYFAAASSSWTCEAGLDGLAGLARDSNHKSETPIGGVDVAVRVQSQGNETVRGVVGVAVRRSVTVDVQHAIIAVSVCISIHVHNESDAVARCDVVRARQATHARGWAPDPLESEGCQRHRW